MYLPNSEGIFSNISQSFKIFCDISDSIYFVVTETNGNDLVQ